MKLRAPAVALLAMLVSQPAFALGDSFTYQGSLVDANAPANGIYDLQFTLQTTAGTPIGAGLIKDDVVVAAGVFSVELDFGPVISNADYQLLIGVRPGASVAAFTELSPATRITPAPQAQIAAVAQVAASVLDGSIGAVQINPAQVQARIDAGCPSGQSIQSVSATGSVTCEASSAGPVGPQGPAGPAGPAGATGPQGASGADGSIDAWGRLGTAGTDPVNNFIGTTDNQPFAVRARNQRVAEFRSVALSNPVGGFSANVLLGSPENLVGSGLIGATISGGGARTGDSVVGLSGEGPNTVLDHFGTIGGGYANQAGDGVGSTNDRPHATVGGGSENTASGRTSVVGGGSGNTASGSNASIAGGVTNIASGTNSSIAGGNGNAASGSSSAIGGGGNNLASGTHSVVGGGLSNSATGDNSAVLGGNTNSAVGAGATVSGGINNCAGGWYSWAGGWRAKVRPGTDPGGSGPCSGLSYPGGSGDIGTFVWAGFDGSDFVSTGDEQFLVRAPGGIGFNTNAPITAFDVLAERSNSHVAMFSNTGTNSPSGVQIRLNTATPTAASNFLTFERNNGSNIGSVEGNGAGGVVFNTSGGDYAEYLPNADPLADFPPGSVLGLRAGMLRLDTRNAEQLVVVSSRPAISGNDPGEDQRADYSLVAFLGQVDVRVSGPVAAGDFLIASGLNDGNAVALPLKALRPEHLAHIVGRAWQGTDEQERGPVRAMVALSPSDAARTRLLVEQASSLAAIQHELAELRSQLDTSK